MSTATHPNETDKVLPYGDGSNKIFGMENFGNTCYCNSILQCLYYSENFRTKLVSHKMTQHARKNSVQGVKPHQFTLKYEQLLNKKVKEQGKQVPVSAGGSIDDRPKSSRKSSIFGIKFNTTGNNGGTSESINSGEEGKKIPYIVDAKNCEALSLDQRMKIIRNKDFQDLPLLVTRPTKSNETQDSRVDYSQASSSLLNGDQPQQSQPEGTVCSSSSFIIVGVPYPEKNLIAPINPFNPNPTSDQRKRSALINGPIINLDTSLQLPSEQSDENVLVHALKDLFECMVENKSKTGVVSPTHFITTLKEKNYLFRQNNMHHDAHEFFNYLINEIIELLNVELGEANNWCNQLFQGIITNETKCLTCETVTSKHEFFLDLSVDIPPGESSYSLTHSLNNFSKSETLTNQDKFYCNTCSSLQEATKTIKLKKLPEILVINFKRFKYDESVDKMVKLFDSISYPFNLRLFNTTGDDNDLSLYSLYALVIHIGGGPMHGHYVSICKIKNGLWLLFDDETVELVDDSYVMRFFGNGPGLATAYILFYSKNSESSDDTADGHDSNNFGFDENNLYHGNEYEILRNTNSFNTESSSKAPVSREKEDHQKSDQSSTDSTGVRDFSSEQTKKTSIFKKPVKPEPLKDDLPPSRAASITRDKEKKTWVGGIMRRESKQELNVERKQSNVSTASTEKKRNIFGFRKK